MTRFLMPLAILLVSLVSMNGCTKRSDTAGTATDASQNSAIDKSAATSAENNNEILIGEVGSLTGGEASFGISTKNGVDIALEEINAAGGIKGKKVKVLVLDNQGKPEEAAIAVTKLITQNKVSAILGEVASSRSMAMAPIAQRYKVPMVSNASTNPNVTKVGDYVFRVCFIDPFQGAVMANFAWKTLKVKRVAILKDVKNDYSMGLSQFFKETFTKLGGEIIKDAEQTYSAGDMSFTAQLTALKSKKPEAIFVPGYYTDIGLIARQAKEIGLNAVLLGGDGWDSDRLIGIGGKALDGHYFSNHYSPDDKNPIAQNFIAKYKERFGVVPDSMAVLGYDAMLVLADGMKRAATLEGKDIRDALAATKQFPGATGKITMNPNRDAEKPAVVIKIEDGKYVFKESINPST